jgi:formylglycine-generating enzyme required for sulfatase activity
VRELSEKFDRYAPESFRLSTDEIEGLMSRVSARDMEDSPGSQEGDARQVTVNGGSWLCAPNFCARYRPAARQPQEQTLGSNHIGFRTVFRAP